MSKVKNKRKNYIFLSVVIGMLFLLLLINNHPSPATKPSTISHVSPNPTIAYLELQVGKNARDYEAKVQLGNGYFLTGAFDKSEQQFRQAIALNNALAPAYQGLANVLRYRGRFSESETAFKKAIEIEPTNDNYYIDLGKLYRNSHKYDEAEISFKKAAKLNPNNDELYSYGLGYLYRDEGRLDEALKMFEKAVELKPDNDFNYMGLGDIYRDLGKDEMSEKMFKKAIGMNPKNESYLGLGYLYLNQMRYNEAENAFKTYLAVIKPKTEVFNGLGYIYLAEKRYSEAESMFKKALAISTTEHSYLGLAKVYVATGNNDGAKMALKKQLEIDPNSQEAKDLLKTL